MSTARKIFLWVGGVSLLLLLALWLQPRVTEVLAPRPVGAFVAIEVEGSGRAVVGPVRVAAGTPFRLHAVLEAEARDGRSIYYTEAPGLSFGGRAIEADRVRRWNRLEQVKALWFTVEPNAPYFVLDPGQRLEKLRFEEFFHPEWSTSWSIEGRLDSHFEEQLADGETFQRDFGTQRYRVWVELYSEASPLLPKARFKSWGTEELIERLADFPTVTATLEGAAGPASAVFGLPGVGVPETAEPLLLEQLARRAQQRLLFTSASVLRDVLDSTDHHSLEGLSWSKVELIGESAWGDVLPGDLLAVGARFVVLYADANGNEKLDDEDLCLDFEEGAAIRRLADVFPGEGEIEWAHPTI